MKQKYLAVMRRTFPTLRLSNVIRLCSLLLTACIVINANNAAAAVFTHVTSHHTGSDRYDTISVNYCGAPYTHLHLDSLLQVSDSAGSEEKFFYDSTYGSHGAIVMSTDAPGTFSGFTSVGDSIVLSGFTGFTTDTPSGLTYTLSYPPRGGDQYLKMVVRSAGLGCGTCFVYDTVILHVFVNPFTADYMFPIITGYNQVREGETIQVSERSTSGHWSTALGNATINDTTGVVTGVHAGIDTIFYHISNVCINITTDSVITVLTNQAPTGGATSAASAYTLGQQLQNYTITGSHLSLTTKVTFGALTATNVSASGTGGSMVVQVPAGATYGRISVLDTVSHLASIDNPTFMPLYDSTSFAPSTGINLQKSVQIPLPNGGFGANSISSSSGSRVGTHPYSVEFGDLDGDGKPDIVVGGTGFDNIVVYPNRASYGSIMPFQTVTPLYFAVPTASNIFNVKLVDLDADGKPEIIATALGSGRVFIFRNTSTPGNISFASPIFFHVSAAPTELTVADFNNDGRPDIGVISSGDTSSTGHGQFVVLRNKYNPGLTTDTTTLLSIRSFDIDTVFNFPRHDSAQPISICTADFNGDGLIDVAISDHVNRNVTVFKNNFVSGIGATTVSFDVAHLVVLSTAAGSGTLAAGLSSGQPYTYATNRTGYPNQVRAADFDGDGVGDLVVAVSDSDLLTANAYNYLYIYKGTSSASISFGARDTIPTYGAAPVGIAFADFDGDHKVDIIVTNAGAASVSIIKNTTSGGAFTSSSFASAYTHDIWPSGVTSHGVPSGQAGPVCIQVGDLDSNTVPDVAVVSREMNSLTLFKNYPMVPVTPISAQDSIVCVGLTDTLRSSHPAPSKGFWSSVNGHVSVAALSPTVDSIGIVTGVSAGYDTVVYAVETLADTSYLYYTVKVLASGAVSGITGYTHHLCPTATEALADASGAGTWVSSDTTRATVSTTGLVTGIAAGTATISYSPTARCITGTATQVVTVDTAGYAAVTGPDSVCNGSSITLSTTATGGVWRSSVTSVATVDSTTGVVTGSAAGTTTISYTLNTTCGVIADTLPIRVNPIPGHGTITGASTPDSVCAGSTTLVTSDSLGGVWTSGTTSVATVGASTGIVTGLTVAVPTTVTISYVVTQHGCASTAGTIPVTVKPLSTAGTITAGSPICVSTSETVTISGASSAGSWSTDGFASTTITSGGVLTVGNTFGSTVVKYTVINPYGCGADSTTTSVTILGKPNPVISPATVNFCIGTTTTLTGSGSTSAAGIWRLSNANASLSTVSGGSTGLLAVTAGTDSLFFTATNTCGTTTIYRIANIAPLADTGTITGPSSVCVGSLIQLSNPRATDTALSNGATWTVSNTRAFLETPFSGGDSVLGVTGGSVIVSYTANSAFCGSLTTTFPLVVNTLPFAGSVLPSPAQVCVGANITLDVSASGGFTSYWMSMDTTLATMSGFSSTTSTAIVTGVAAGTVVVANVDTGSGGCGVSYAYDTITVLPLAPSPGVVMGVDSICRGNSFFLVDTIASTIARSGWSSSNTAIGSIQSISSNTDTIWVNTLASGLVTFFFTDTNICGTNQTSHSVQVNAAPHITPMTPASVCDGVLFTHGVPGTDSTIASSLFTWNRNAVPGISNTSGTGTGGISETLNNSTTTSQVTVYVYTVGLHGCSDSANLSVTVNPTPHLTSAKNEVVCSGSPFNYIDSESTGTTTSALWVRYKVPGVLNGPNRGSHVINEVLTDSIQLAENVQYIYTLTAAGCTHTDTLFVAIDPTATAPSISTHSLATECSGTMYQNFGAQIAPVSPATYSWYGTGGASVWATGGTRQYCLVNFTTPGSSYVYVEATLSGYNCPVKDSFNVNISNAVADNPEVIYFNGDFICTSNVEEFYQWGTDAVGTLDSSMFYGQTNQNFTELLPDFTHFYYWVITGRGGCTQKSYYIAPTGVKNVTASMGEMSVYPNPATQVVNVEVSNTNGGKFTAELVNMLGQKVESRDLAGNKATFDIANVQSGIYFIDCYRDGVKFATAKFVKN